MTTYNPLLHQLFRYANHEWYESLDHYHPSDELLRVVCGLIPPGWHIRRNNISFHVQSAATKLPRQGWKIHISATPANCEAVLHHAATVCVRQQAPFKFALDRRLMALSTYKGWGREASGKFITIYPLDEKHFYRLLEALYEVLHSFDGPYILSDRRYKDARTIYYRYGGIDGLRILSYSGDRQLMLVSPDGDLIPDWRMPYWNPPPWISDPFEQPGSDESQSVLPSLKDGRYQIEQALSFSVYGGVYVATDLDTASSVVIKEARPATGFESNGSNAIDRLRKEYRLLQKMQDAGVTPAPVDLFEDWEHLFLVEEYIPGLHLGHFTISYCPLLRPHSDEQVIEAHVEKLGRIWSNLALGLATLHDRGIVCGDLSLTNVIVKNADLGEVRFVDLEAAWEEGVDTPIQLATPGYTDPARKGAVTKEDDAYALGAVMLGTLFPIINVLDVEPSAAKVFVQTMGNDLGLPQRVRRVVEGCLNPDPFARPTPGRSLK